VNGEETELTTRFAVGLCLHVQNVKWFWKEGGRLMLFSHLVKWHRQVVLHWPCYLETNNNLQTYKYAHPLLIQTDTLQYDYM